MIEFLARRHRVRIRRVLLRGSWWRTDNGPLISLVDGGRRAVLLSPRRFGGYVMVEPPGGERRTVREPERARLAPVAYTVIEPFPRRRLSFRALVRFALRGTGRDIARLVAAGSAVAALGMVPPMAIAFLFNSVVPQDDVQRLFALVFVLVVAALLTGVLLLVRSLSVLRMEAISGARLQSALFDHLLSLPAPFFRQYSAGDLGSRALVVDEIRGTLTGPVIGAVLTGVMGAAGIVMMYWYARPDWALAHLASVLIVGSIVPLAVFGRRQLEHEVVESRIRVRASGLAFGLFEGIVKLRTAGAERRAFRRWASLFVDQKRAAFSSARESNRLIVSMSIYPVLATVMLFAAAHPALREPATMSTGNFLALLAAFNVALGAVASAGRQLTRAFTALPRLELVRPILAAAREDRGAVRHPGHLRGGVALDRVTYTYPGQTRPALSEVSLVAEPGEFIAIVGRTGSGKSTVLRLLLGFDEPDTGSVLLDGQRLSDLDREEVRRQIGVVLQDSQVGGSPIHTCILGAWEGGMDAAWKAADVAGLAEDIRAMPMAMYTVVDPAGSSLSAGQRQRLLIARALVRSPAILLLDEATSALDNLTQDKIAGNLAALKVTRIVVAHRLSTVQAADRIYVLEAGRVAEVGDFASLSKGAGPFVGLIRRQLA